MVREDASVALAYARGIGVPPMFRGEGRGNESQIQTAQRKRSRTLRATVDCDLLVPFALAHRRDTDATRHLVVAEGVAADVFAEVFALQAFVEALHVAEAVAGGAAGGFVVEAVAEAGFPV